MSNSTFRPQKQRRWSFTSRAMAIGSFPESVQFTEPIINAVLIFQDCPTQKDVVDQVVMKLLEYDRFKGVYNVSYKEAVPCDDLDPTDLVRVVQHESKDESDLFKLVEEHMYDSISEGSRGQVLPWWEFLILQNKNKKGPSAVIWRIHHALADGISMVKVVQNMITDMDGNPLSEVLPPNMKKKFQTKRSTCSMIGQFFSALGTIAGMPKGPFDDDTIFSKKFKGDMVYTKNRSIIRFEPIPLDFVKALKNAADVSLNDIMFTCVSQAIHDYLVEQDDPVLKKKGKDLLCRALMPIGFPSTKRGSDPLGNTWCFLNADMAVGIEDIMERLRFVNGQMSKLKLSLVPLLTIWLQNNVLEALPLGFNRDQVFSIISRRSTVFSNVPGPNIPCGFAGKEVSGCQMVFGNLITQLGILSYRGTIFGNFCLDSTDMPNVDRLSVHVSGALVKLANELEVECPKNIRDHSELLTEC